MKMIGKLIVFEGPDAAGKSSLCRLFKDALEFHGSKVHLLSFPGSSPGTIGELVYRIHHAPEEIGLNEITPTGLQALHVAAHLDSIESAIIPRLLRGETVILDRYWWSTVVYGSVAGANRAVMDSLIRGEKILWGACVPAALFCVFRSAPLRREPMDKWHNWTEGYRSLVTSEEGDYPIFAIDNDRTQDECLASILAHWQSVA